MEGYLVKEGRQECTWLIPFVESGLAGQRVGSVPALEPKPHAEMGPDPEGQDVCSHRGAGAAGEWQPAQVQQLYFHFSVHHERAFPGATGAPAAGRGAFSQPTAALGQCAVPPRS